MESLPLTTNDQTLPRWLPCSELAEGDVVFVGRPGFVQRLVEIAGDRFRHVGIVKFFDDEPFVLEAGRAGFRSRPLSTFIAAYEFHAVVKLSMCPDGCGRDVAAEALRLLRTPTSYPSRSDLFAVGLVALARQYGASSTSATCASIYDRAERQLCGPDSLATTLCASLIVRSLSAACSRHRPVIDLRQPKGAEPQRDGPLSDVAALPDDIWRAFDQSERFQLGSDNLIDLNRSPSATTGRAAADATAGPNPTEQPRRPASA